LYAKRGHHAKNAAADRAVPTEHNKAAGSAFQEPVRDRKEEAANAGGEVQAEGARRVLHPAGLQDPAAFGSGDAEHG